MTNLRWNDPTHLAWDDVVLGDLFNVYGGDADDLSYGYFGDCLANTTSNIHTDSIPPAPGSVQFYLVTVEVAGAEGSLGFATGAERSNFDRCP